MAERRKNPTILFLIVAFGSIAAGEAGFFFGWVVLAPFIDLAHLSPHDQFRAAAMMGFVAGPVGAAIALAYVVRVATRRC